MKKPSAFVSYAALAITYLLLNIFLPATQQNLHAYNLQISQYRILLTFLALPVIAIWLLAFYGATKLNAYAKRIDDTAEGRDFALMAAGCSWLAWGLPIFSITAVTFGAIANAQPAFFGASVIIGNYISLIFPIVAFTLLGSGARGLLERTGSHLTLTDVRGLMLGFLAIGVGYCFLVFEHINLRGGTHNSYFLSPWLVVCTLIIPYLYAWYVGLFGAYEIALFSKNVTGVLYKQGLRLVAAGIFTLVIGSVGLQYYTSLHPSNPRLTIGFYLVAVDLLRLVLASGYIMVALGANKLRKIEEV